MANRLTKIYTRTGDDGTTGKADGGRVAKDAPLIQAIGDIDELNSVIAIVVCHAPDDFSAALKSIQNRLFDIGGELAMSGSSSAVAPVITAHDVAQLERLIDQMNGRLQPLEEFILPGGSTAASYCHLARTVCRRGERSLIALKRAQEMNDALMAYVNRLSDLLFVLARRINQDAGIEEIYWEKR